MPAAPLRLTEGPITPALLRLAWPVLVSRALHTLYGVVDTFWVGRVGPEAIAAVATSTFALWTLFSLGDVLIAGVGALASQAIGARRDADAAAAARAGLALALGMGLAVAAAGWWGARPLFDAILDDPLVVAYGGEYLSLVALLAPVFFVDFVFETTYRSCGDSRTPMRVMLAATILNVILDPVLILGIGPFPALGVRGAALATIISQVLAVAAYLVLWAAGRLPLRLARDGRALVALPDVAGILRIGTPWAATGILFSGVYLVLSRIAGTFGAATLAALGIVNRLESLNYVTASAAGMGVSTMVGQNFGAGKPDRSAAAADRGAILITWISGAVAVAFLAFPERIARVFTDDPVALAEAATFLRIVAVSQPMMCWEIVYQGAFSGVGQTLPPMFVSVGISILRVPLAWWTAITLGHGADALWHAITWTAVARGLLVTWWFRTGTWRRRAPAPPEAPRAAAMAGPGGPDG